MLKKKESPGLNKLLEGCMPSLRGKAQSYLGKDAQYLCDDAISNTLFEVFKAFPKFIPKKNAALGEAFSAWIGEILKNKCLDKNRSLNKTKKKPDQGGGKKKRETSPRFIKLDKDQNIEDVIDAEKWLNDDYTGAVHNLIDGYPETDPADIPSVEDYLRWNEELDSDDASIYIEDEPTGCMMFYVRGDNYGLKRFTWDGPEPPDITMFKMIVKGTPRKTIAKKFPGKNIDVTIHRMKKKMMGV